MLKLLIRLAANTDKRGFRVLAMIVNRWIRLLYSCEISYRASIHPTVQFPHKALGVVVGDGVVIGAGSRVLQNVTIGGRSGLTGMPVLGRDVLVGAGACILGPVVIGDGASIGANAVVLIDVPAGGVAIGVPARTASRTADR
jgi:serine O-acetyltransferase